MSASIFDEREQDAKPSETEGRARGEISRATLQIHFYHSLSVTIAWRCLGNARSCFYCTRPYRRAARHDKGGVVSGCAALRAPSEKYKQTNLSRAATQVAACEGEFAFRAKRTNQFLSLAQNCSICAKEEPLAQKAGKPRLLGLLQNAPCGDEEKSPGLRFRYTPAALVPYRGEGSGVGGRGRLVILSDSDGSPCLTILQAMQRCLGNARSRFVLRPTLSARCSA